MEAKATHYSATCTPRKARRLRDLIIGKNAALALAILAAERRAGSVSTAKLLRSALAQLPAGSEGRALVTDLVVNDGPRRGMFMPRAKGSASPVIKRTSHLTIKLSLA